MPYKRKTTRFHRKRKPVLKRLKHDVAVLKTEMKATESFQVFSSNLNVATIDGEQANASMGWAGTTNWTVQSLTYLPTALPGSALPEFGIRSGPKVRWNKWYMNYTIGMDPAKYDGSKQVFIDPSVRVMVLLVKQMPLNNAKGTQNLDFCDVFALLPDPVNLYNYTMNNQSFFNVHLNPLNKKYIKVLYDKRHSIGINSSHSNPNNANHHCSFRMPAKLITTYLDGTDTYTSASQNHVFLIAMSNLPSASQALSPIVFTSQVIGYFEQ